MLNGVHPEDLGSGCLVQYTGMVNFWGYLPSQVFGLSSCFDIAQGQCRSRTCQTLNTTWARIQVTLIRAGGPQHSQMQLSLNSQESMQFGSGSLSSALLRRASILLLSIHALYQAWPRLEVRPCPPGSPISHVLSMLMSHAETVAAQHGGLKLDAEPRLGDDGLAQFVGACSYLASR